ncbi:MAG: quinolinate synthase NadA [Myxococcales bacterium]|nr:quinolinate synthase NadA [Myxococcales bacterium]
MSTPSAVHTKAFPSLRIGPEGFSAQGAFAEAQAMYLEPDPDTVARLAELLAAHGVGVVAHFYMDAELQGVLAACAHEHVHVADSLLMADRAVQMAEAGARAIVVLGVDFMSENVRATLDASGLSHVSVYRVATQPIGCSLAESAEAPAYGAYLKKAAETPRALHVIYVNTSLRVKARATSIIPTITCTSSNVVPLVLQAFAQVPDLHIFFGPDTYMGRNLHQMLKALSELDADAIRELHPEHTPETLRSAVERFHYFEQGVCIVHHMFGDHVVDQVRRDYDDAFITAHLEVPGEMFGLGFEAQQRGRGVVGSTSNILKFITDKVRERARSGGEHPRFVLGTESGMVTSIARGVQRILREHEGSAQDAEIIFPVASEAIATTEDPLLSVIPGVAGGEGCSTAGGCATCPFMKMNSLDALFDLLEQLDAGPEALAPYAPKSYEERIDGKTIADLGAESIIAMRAFSKDGKLPANLVDSITGS